MNSWSERIRLQMKEIGLTQEQVAEKMGITRGAITHYLAGRRVPPLKQFQKLASILKSDPAWLQFGINPDSSTIKHVEKEEKQPEKYHPIPVLTFEQACQHVDVSRMKSRNVHDCIPNFFIDQPRWFALRVKGDSMTSFTNGKSINEGDMVIVDPDAEPSHGDFVIAIMPKAKEATLKQYVIDAGNKYLKPLNMQYPIIKFEKGTAIIAVVKKIIHD